MGQYLAEIAAVITGPKYGSNNRGYYRTKFTSKKCGYSGQKFGLDNHSYFASKFGTDNHGNILAQNMA